MDAYHAIEAMKNGKLVVRRTFDRDKVCRIVDGNRFECYDDYSECWLSNDTQIDVFFMSYFEPIENTGRMKDYKKFVNALTWNQKDCISKGWRGAN